MSLLMLSLTWHSRFKLTLVYQEHIEQNNSTLEWNNTLVHLD